eukprot:TRINITY_DN57102_c0_g1_i1.p1 TRINITY_DN57102_c0_g1~~TRINITY_DN57102_c0_g1_i1.p1  ORF type:complete len:549 (-),score=228.69 TRINITY_DN57102_c0_g1_i1:44-1690(-)
MSASGNRVLHIRWENQLKDVARMEISQSATLKTVVNALAGYPPLQGKKYSFLYQSQPIAADQHILFQMSKIEDNIIYIREGPSGDLDDSKPQEQDPQNFKMRIPAIAKKPFNKEGKNRLVLKKGDQLFVLKQVEGPWWWCELNGVCGYAPKDYLILQTAKDAESDDEDAPPPPPVERKKPAKDGDDSGSEEEYQSSKKQPAKKGVGGKYELPEDVMSHLEHILLDAVASGELNLDAMGGAEVHPSEPKKNKGHLPPIDKNKHKQPKPKPDVSGIISKNKVVMDDDDSDDDDVPKAKKAEEAVIPTEEDGQSSEGGNDNDEDAEDFEIAPPPPRDSEAPVPMSKKSKAGNANDSDEDGDENQSNPNLAAQQIAALKKAKAAPVAASIREKKERAAKLKGLLDDGEGFAIPKVIDLPPPPPPDEDEELAAAMAKKREENKKKPAIKATGRKILEEAETKSYADALVEALIDERESRPSQANYDPDASESSDDDGNRPEKPESAKSNKKGKEANKSSDPKSPSKSKSKSKVSQDSNASSKSKLSALSKKKS